MVKSLSVLFIFLSFNFYALAHESSLGNIQIANLSEEIELPFVFEIEAVSPLEPNVLPLFIQRSIDNQNPRVCGGVMFTNQPQILYELHLATTSHNWIPINGKVVETQYWVTSP